MWLTSGREVKMFFLGFLVSNIHAVGTWNGRSGWNDKQLIIKCLAHVHKIAKREYPFTPLHMGCITMLYFPNKTNVRLFLGASSLHVRAWTQLLTIGQEMHLHSRESTESAFFLFSIIILANTGISQLSSAGSNCTTMRCISPCNAHSTQRVYKIKTSLLLRGRDGDTMMSSESSESTAAAPPDSAVHWSFVWSAGETQA